MSKIIPKYDYFNTMNFLEIKEEIEFINDLINKIYHLNNNILISNFGGLNNEAINSYNGEIIIPSIITQEEMIEVIEYFNNLINNNLINNNLKNFNSIFNKRKNYSEDIDYFRILGIMHPDHPDKPNIKNNPIEFNDVLHSCRINYDYISKNINDISVFKEILKKILYQLDYNMNQRLKIKDILLNLNQKKIKFINNYDHTDTSYISLLEELLHIKNLLIIKKYKLFNKF